MKIDISITNENYLEVGKKIQNAITKAFGEGSFSYNISKGKSNYSITHFDLPLKFIYPKHYKKDIFYDGGFYKGYYAIRGIRMFDFSVELKNEISSENIEGCSEEIDKMALFFKMLSEINTQVNPLKTEDSSYEQLETEFNGKKMVDFSKMEKGGNLANYTIGGL